MFLLRYLTFLMWLTCYVVDIAPAAVSLTPQNQCAVDEALRVGQADSLGTSVAAVVDWATDNATIDALINAEHIRQEKQRLYNQTLLTSVSLDPLGIKNTCLGLYVSDVSKAALVGVDFISECFFYTQVRKRLIDHIISISVQRKNGNLPFIQFLSGMVEQRKKPVESCDSTLEESFKSFYAETSIFTNGLIGTFVWRVALYQGLAGVRDYYMLDDIPHCLTDLINHCMHPSPNPIPVFAFLQLKPLVSLHSDLVQADLTDIPVALAKEYDLIPECLTGKLFEWSKQFFLYAVCVNYFYKNILLHEWYTYCQVNAQGLLDCCKQYEQSLYDNDVTKMVTTKREIEKQIQDACNVPFNSWLKQKQAYGAVWNIAWNAIRLAPAFVEVVTWAHQFYDAVQKQRNVDQGMSYGV